MPSYSVTRFIHVFGTLILLAPVTASAGPGFQPAPTEGQTFVHDPSSIVKEGSRFYLFSTGSGLRSLSSPDLVQWTNGPSVFAAPPPWTARAVPGFRGYGWAPDGLWLNGQYHLYYSISTFGSHISAIGLITTPTLNPAASNYLWSDCGPVLQSSQASPYNAIDPSVLRDVDGRLWMAFGSFWQGIFLTELDPQTGGRLRTNSPLHRIAWNQSIEAACLTRHGGYYYLFVNWGECCKGTNSTYEVRVGRAKTVTGPYLDRNGTHLTDGGGSPFLHSSGRFIGPGHVGMVDDGAAGGPIWFSYHYYDATTRGRSRLALARIDWSQGWPVPVRASAPDPTR